MQTGSSCHIEASPPYEHEEDFAQVMSAQLRRAPWFAISLVLHVVAGLLLYLALDEPLVVRQVVAAAVEPAPEEDPPPPDPVEHDEPIEVPEQVDEPLVDEPVTNNDTDNPEPQDDAQDSEPTAFTSTASYSPVGIGGGAGNRFGSRGGRRGGRGAPRDVEPRIRAGLDWLARHQDDSGRWDCDGFMKHDADGKPCDGAGNPVHDVGVTGLALLAFLGDGSTLRSGHYKEQVKGAVKWLRSQQGPNGLFGSAASHDFVYDHAIAAYAMCEAYGLSNYRTLRGVAQKGIEYLESHRNPYGCWRYQPRDGSSDVSVTGWCIMAYKSAKDFGIPVNEQALATSLTFLDEITDPASGHCGYTRRGEPSSRHPGDHGVRFPIERGAALTAVGLFCRFFLGQDPRRQPVMQKAADLLLAKPPSWQEGGGVDHYYWYYGSYALFQMGPPHWDRWRRHLTPAVLRTQRNDGNFAGSWDPAGAWGEDGGRVYSTAILVLTLEAYFRYTRLVR